MKLITALKVQLKEIARNSEVTDSLKRHKDIYSANDSAANNNILATLQCERLKTTSGTLQTVHGQKGYTVL